MTRARHDEFDQAMISMIGADPYGHGSNAVGGEKDRRQSTVAGAIVVYYVAGGALTVTAVKVIDHTL